MDTWFSSGGQYTLLQADYEQCHEGDAIFDGMQKYAGPQAIRFLPQEAQH